MSKNTASFKSRSNHFSMIPSADIQRSRFDRSHAYKTTFDAGKLIPFYVDEVVPGDTFSLKCSVLVRQTTPVVPFMDNVYMESFFFFVPNRLIWEHWEQMLGDQSSGPTASTDYLVPSHGATESFKSGSLADYFGLPTNVTPASIIQVSDLPLRAYSLIFNEWFRDENLQEPVNVDKNTGRLFVGDAPITSASVNNYLSFWSEPLYRCKRHDYFTSALPWTQKGPSVDVSIGVSGPISWKDESYSVVAKAGGSWVHKEYQVQNPNNRVFLAPHGVVSRGSSNNIDLTLPVNQASSGLWNPKNTFVKADGTGPNLNQATVTSPIDLPTLYFQGQQGTGITINELREAFQIQKFYERQARGGTRYTEIIRSHFGVISPDARLQRPEYLGGSSSRINVNQVQQTSASDSTTPQGNLAAFAVGRDSFHGFTKSFVEHGFIIGLINVRADITYQQGLNRLWSRRGKFDFYWPVFAHLGEQAVLNQEIYCDGSASDQGIFGYQERYADYRYYPSIITGKLRSTDPQPLDYWHLAQKFENCPKLNSEFIQDTASYQGIKRASAVQNEPQFVLDSWFDLKCVRPMPVYGVPGLVDHF